MKKRTALKILIILTCAAAVFAGASVTLNVYADGDNAVIQWSTSNESNVENYVVQKRTPSSDFIDIATISPNSNHFYQYEDKSVYKTNDAIYIYRVKIVDYNNPNYTYSREASVSMNISGIKRTWGSIKAMFR